MNQMIREDDAAWKSLLIDNFKVIEVNNHIICEFETQEKIVLYSKKDNVWKATLESHRLTAPYYIQENDNADSTEIILEVEKLLVTSQSKYIDILLEKLEDKLVPGTDDLINMIMDVYFLIDKLKKIEHSRLKDAHDLNKKLNKEFFNQFADRYIGMIIDGFIDPFFEILQEVIKKRNHYWTWDLVHREISGVRELSTKSLIKFFYDKKDIALLFSIIEDISKNKMTDSSGIINPEYFKQNLLNHKEDLAIILGTKINTYPALDFSKLIETEFKPQKILDFEGNEIILLPAEQEHIWTYNTDEGFSLNTIKEILEDPDKVLISTYGEGSQIFEKSNSIIAITNNIIKTVKRKYMATDPGESVTYCFKNQEGVREYPDYEEILEMNVNVLRTKKGKPHQHSADLKTRTSQVVGSDTFDNIRTPGTTRENLLPKKFQRPTFVKMYINGQEIQISKFNLKTSEKTINKVKMSILLRDGSSHDFEGSLNIDGKIKNLIKHEVSGKIYRVKEDSKTLHSENEDLPIENGTVYIEIKNRL